MDAEGRYHTAAPRDRTAMEVLIYPVEPADPAVVDPTVEAEAQPVVVVEVAVDDVVVGYRVPVASRIGIAALARRVPVCSMSAGIYSGCNCKSVKVCHFMRAVHSIVW